MNKKTSSKSTFTSLNRVFAKCGDIICQQWNDNQRQNMKVSNSSPSVVFERRSATAQDGYFIEALANNNNNNNGAPYLLDTEPTERQVTCRLLMERLLQALREAKLQRGGGEIMLPHDLIPKIAEQVIMESEDEPYGLRGCSIYVHLQNYKDMQRQRINTLKLDPNTVSTFEIHLTLLQDSGLWSLVRRRGAIQVSSSFLLEKKKLYRSSSGH